MNTKLWNGHNAARSKARKSVFVYILDILFYLAVMLALFAGARVFLIECVNSLNPGEGIMYESGVIGKVALTVPGLGAVISHFGPWLYLALIAVGLFIVLSLDIRGLFTKRSVPGGGSHAELWRIL